MGKAAVIDFIARLNLSLQNIPVVVLNLLVRVPSDQCGRGGTAVCVSWLQAVKLNLFCDYCVCTHVWVHMIPCAIDAHVEVRRWLCGVSFTFMWDFRVGYFIWFTLSVTLSFREQPFLEYLKNVFSPFAGCGFYPPALWRHKASSVGAEEPY